MNSKKKSARHTDSSKICGLEKATLKLWERRGHAGASARLIANWAGVPTSSIYHHFGSMERLYLSAQRHATLAAERWCEAQLDALGRPGAIRPEAFGALAATLIDDWTRDERQFAFAWRECQLMAARNARFRPALALWRGLWSSFWENLCERCGLTGLGEVCDLFFDGESMLHLMPWRRAIDRSALEETCAGWALWMDGKPALSSPWRDLARQETVPFILSDPASGGEADRVAEAAADIVERRGMLGLTHRAVAIHTGLTLGTVSHRFRTSADLARIAIEALYHRHVSIERAELLPFSNPEDAAKAWNDAQRKYVGRLSIDELILATARSGEFRILAPGLRYRRGESSSHFLSAMLGTKMTISSLDAALFSSFGAGQRHACLGLTEQGALSLVASTLKALPLLAATF